MIENIKFYIYINTKAKAKDIYKFVLLFNTKIINSHLFISHMINIKINEMTNLSKK
jgi:hypothetical protein